MPSGPKNAKAARKKKNKNKNKKKNMKASFSNPPAEKVFAETEAVSEMVMSENEANGSSESVVTEVDESGDAGESSYHVPPTIANAEKIAADVKLSEIVTADVVMSKSVSNVFESDMIAVGDVNAQPVSEMSSNENEGNESSESADNQNTFQEVLIEASSNKIERNKTCESVVSDEVKLQESLTKSSKKSERNVPFGSVDHQISLDKSVIGPTSYETEMWLNENGGSESNKSVSQKFLIKTISNNTVETNESSDSVVTDEVFLEETLVETTLKKAEAYDPSKSEDEQIVLDGSLVEPIINKTEKYNSLEFVSDQNNLQKSLIEPTLSKVDITECGEMSLESALDGLSLRSPDHPPHEHINESSMVLLTEKVAADVMLSEIVAAGVVLSGSVSNVFESETIAVGDVNAQPVSEMGSNVNEGNESSESGEQVHPQPEPLRRSLRNTKQPSRFKDYYVSPQVKSKLK